MVIGPTTLDVDDASSLVGLEGSLVEVKGDFENGLLQDNTGGLPYPFPELLGGSFLGSFSFNSNATQSGISDHYALFDVDISVYDSHGNLIQTIGDYDDDEFREISRSGIAFLGKSANIVNQLQDLRLNFLFDTNPGDGKFPISEFLNATPASGIIETDARPGPFFGWNVAVSEFDFEARVVPEPTLLHLHMLILVLAYRLGIRRIRRG